MVYVTHVMISLKVIYLTGCKKYT